MDEAKPERVLRSSQGAGANYTQVNILFPSEQVELPSAEKFKAFPPEAQEAILIAFGREQVERHVWLKNQQPNEHAFNMQSGKHFYHWRMSGLVGGVFLATTSLLSGVWLVINGASVVGTCTMIVSVGTMVGAVIYGHRSSSESKKEENASKP